MSRTETAAASTGMAPMRVTVKLRDYLWRPLTDSAADTDFVVALRSEERFRAMFYNTQITPETHRKFIHAADARGDLNWLVERAGKPVGIASIYNFDYTNRKAECGRIASLDPRMFHFNWVVSAKIAMDVIGTNKLYIETLESNSIIARAVERMGMIREGVLRHHIIRDGVPLNVLLYTNTNEEWQQMKGAHYEKWGEPELLEFEGRKMVG